LSHFDVVAILRGGGGDVGLSFYNNYDLASKIALFPIPVLTGIGHSTNETVCEMVSYSNQITPTKVAEYLIQKFHNFSVPVKDAEKKIISETQWILEETKSKFASETKLFFSGTKNLLFKNKTEIKEFSKAIDSQTRFLLKEQKNNISAVKEGINKGSKSIISSDRLLLNQNSEKLSDRIFIFIKERNQELINIEKNTANMSPETVLKRGYSITKLTRDCNFLIQN
jgi:exodeoxyribonuclease VII large subunit